MVIEQTRVDFLVDANGLVTDAFPVIPNMVVAKALSKEEIAITLPLLLQGWSRIKFFLFGEKMEGVTLQLKEGVETGDAIVILIAVTPKGDSVPLRNQRIRCVFEYSMS